MIHAHHFYFADQPKLQEEYESFGFQRVENEQEAIVVKEMDLRSRFERRIRQVSMSGRHCTYLGNGEFKNLEEGDWGLEVMDVLSLAWDSERGNIYYEKGNEFTPERLRFWAWHTFFPIVLALEKQYKMMHVGAVEIDGGPVFFSASSFGGKSTMTHHFLEKGHPLYSDDTLPIKKEGKLYITHPSFPYHRPYREPETLGKPFRNFALQPAPIKAIFELKSVAPDASVEIAPAKGVEKFNILHQSHFIRFPFLKHERFAFAFQMAKVVPVYNITVPWDLKRLSEVYEVIIRQASSD